MQPSPAFSPVRASHNSGTLPRRQRWFWRPLAAALAAWLFVIGTVEAVDQTAKESTADAKPAPQAILEEAGLWPLPASRPAVPATRGHHRSHSGYAVENVTLETAPGVQCAGNLYRPLLRHDLGPAVLFVDSVETDRRFTPERQIMCAHLARSGVTVLACNTTFDTTAVKGPAPTDFRPLHVWNSLRAVDFLAGLDRIDLQRIGVIAADGALLKQVDRRLAIAVDPARAASPEERGAAYALLGQTLRLKPDPFFAQSFAQPREPTPQPSEDRDKIKVETIEELTAFDDQQNFDNAGLTNEHAVTRLASYLDQLRGAASAGPAVASLAGARPAEYVAKELEPGDEATVFTPPGFRRVGVRKVAAGPDVGRLNIAIRDGHTGTPTPCRVNVVGPDGNYYEPSANPLKEHSYTSEWPDAGWGNRTRRAPVRYLGRSFYTTGECSVDVPAGAVRIEAWKGFEYRPEVFTVAVPKGATRSATIKLTRAVNAAEEGFWSGDPHIHIQRRDNEDQDRIFDLLECEDTHFGTVLAYNEPPGPYHGLMKHLDSPQQFGLGRRSVATRGDYAIISGQEYRSSNYGHLNLFLLDSLVLDGQSSNADRWPPFGLVARDARKLGGIAFYAHGGYSQAIWADVAQGDVDGVELLQHGAYRGIGLLGWYNMLNTGYRLPANGAADYPACRMLSDCKTYVYADKRPTMEEWLHGMSTGRSFVSSGPLITLNVDGLLPGAIIEKSDVARVRVTARVRVRSEVAPVTNVQLIANGRIVDELTLPASQGQGNWIELEREIELTESAWIAARAFSQSPLGAPNAEAHTNPVYVYFQGRAPYDRQSLDAWLAALDGQINLLRQRKFEEQAKMLDYFERSRDILTKIRQAGGVAAAGHPAQIADDLPRIDDATAREHTPAELQAFLKPVPPKPFAEFMKSFDTVGGFTMQPLAQEPLVYDPIAAAFDENGQLYVCEMRDYPYKPAPGKLPLGDVRLLLDTDGNGTFDESHVFAEQLLWAGGVAPWRGGVFLAAPPDIWYLKDTDGDHRADIRRRIFTGFGTQNQQAMLNNLTLGLDHKIYGSTAGNGGKIRCVELPSGGQPADVPAVDVNGRDFRFDPETGAFEAITGTMQFGNTFDDWDNRFLCSESQPLLHALMPQHYLVRNPYLPVPNVLQNVVPPPVPIFRTSPVERWRMIRSSRRIAHGERSATSPGASHHVIDAAAGVTVYRGGAYPAAYYGSVFVSDAQNNLIHRRTLSPDGVTFKSARIDANTEFVRSSDPWFRPVNLLNAPDGTLYVLDMSREILESIHVPSDVVKFLDLTSGRNFGRIFRLAPPGFQYPGRPRLGNFTTAELVAALESPHGWWRDTAHRLLFERQDASAVEPLRQLLSRSRVAQARLHALWSLRGLRALSDDDLATAFGDEHSAIREHAMRLAESRLDHSPELLDRVIALAGDPHPRMRFQAAFSLGESHDPRAAVALADLARSSSADPCIRTAILSSAAQLAPALTDQLLNDRPFATSTEGQQFIAQLVFFIGARNQTAEVHALLERLTQHEPLPTNPVAPPNLLAALGRGLRQSGARLESGSNLPAVAATYIREAVRAAIATAQSENADIASRRRAIELLSDVPLTEAHDTLTSLLDPQQPTDVRIAAIQALADFAEPEIGTVLLGRWATFEPAVRDAAAAAMLARGSRTMEFLQAALDGQIPLASVGAAQRSLLQNHPNANVRALARKVFADSSSSRSELIAAYSTKRNDGTDRARGEAIFRRECMACHKIGETGHSVGPDLTSTTFRDGTALVEQILDPNRNVPPKYESYICVDQDGRITTGILVSQTATSVTLAQQNGEPTTILRTNIDEMTSTGKSLMPEGFEKNLTPEEMAHLVAFLQASHGPESDVPLEIGTAPGMVEPER